MQLDNSDDAAEPASAPLVRVSGRLQLVLLDPLEVPQRRRAPRRRLVMSVAGERRRADRRSAKPGVDGLLRTVLADIWKEDGD